MFESMFYGDSILKADFSKLFCLKIFQEYQRRVKQFGSMQSLSVLIAWKERKVTPHTYMCMSSLKANEQPTGRIFVPTWQDETQPAYIHWPLSALQPKRHLNGVLLVGR